MAVLMAVIGWIALAVYLIGFFRSVKPLAESSLENILARAQHMLRAEAALYPNTFRSKHPNGMPTLKPTPRARARAVEYGTMRALFWPVTMPILALSRTITTADEREQAARKELERLKAAAKEAGLDWPEMK